MMSCISPAVELGAERLAFIVHGAPEDHAHASYPAVGEELLNVSRAHGEPRVEPYRLSNYIGWMPMPLE